MRLQAKISSASILLLVLSFVSSPAADQSAPYESEFFEFKFDQEEYIEFADLVLTEARADMTDLLGHTLSYRPTVYLVDNRARFDELIEGSFPDWGAAAASVARRFIIIKSPHAFNIRKPFDELLRHEYSHLALADRLGGNRAPRWLDEGLAIWISKEWSWSDNMAIGLAIIWGDLIPLREIERLNSFNENKAHLAYAQSYLTLQYMLEEYGTAGLGIFLDELSRGAFIDEALVAGTGSDYATFDDEVRAYVGNRFNLLILAANNMYFWLALALILIVGGYFQFKRRKQYYKKWEEDEVLHSTDFDYGDPDNPEQTDDEEPWRN